MKSRRDGILILCIVLIAAILAGCGAAEQRPALERIEYTNLNDSGSRELLKELLSDAGVPDGRIQSFFRRVAEKTGGTGLPPRQAEFAPTNPLLVRPIPHNFAIKRTRSTQLNFRLCAPGFAAWIGVHTNVQKFLSVFAVKGCSPFVRGLFLFSR